MFRNKLLAIFICTLCFSVLRAQNELDQSNLRFYLSEDKSSCAGMLMVNQIWTRHIWNNPGFNGEVPSGDFDVGIRRSRLIFYTRLLDKVFIYTQAGFDGLSFRHGGKPGVSLYNAQTEYSLVKDKLHLGFGLHTWNGVSRYNNSSLLEFLVADNPGFAYPVGGTFDRFGRQLGIYAKGTVDKLHYRLALVKPFETGSVTGLPNQTRERLNDNPATKGYFCWHFFDREGTLFPYMSMNNLGRAKLLNLGAGFYYHPEAMTGIWGGQSEIMDIFLFGVDAFLDMPLNNNGAITSYLGFFNYDFGRNYLRASGKMNVAQARDYDIALSQGIGNSEWEIGTGQVVRGELGYLLPGEILNSGFQPFGAFSYKNFEALDDASLQFDFGANLLMHGHNIKWTLQYSTRPVYRFNALEEYKGQIILQTQIFF